MIVPLQMDKYVSGISLKVMDECHVSLADLRLSSAIFEFYSCDNSWSELIAYSSISSTSYLLSISLLLT